MVKMRDAERRNVRHDRLPATGVRRRKETPDVSRRPVLERKKPIAPVDRTLLTQTRAARHGCTRPATPPLRHPGGALM